MLTGAIHDRDGNTTPTNGAGGVKTRVPTADDQHTFYSGRFRHIEVPLRDLADWSGVRCVLDTPCARRRV
ncbi:MAG: hypothetical protein JJU45_02605 [Acidimicrobiia bacterium]|nr:hypothetical protein [Acidimicrobiia bacterium]